MTGHRKGKQPASWQGSGARAPRQIAAEGVPAPSRPQFRPWTRQPGHRGTTPQQEPPDSTSRLESHTSGTNPRQSSLREQAGGPAAWQPLRSVAADLASQRARDEEEHAQQHALPPRNAQQRGDPYQAQASTQGHERYSLEPEQAPSWLGSPLHSEPEGYQRQAQQAVAPAQAPEHDFVNYGVAGFIPAAPEHEFINHGVAGFTPAPDSIAPRRQFLYQPRGGGRGGGGRGATT